MRSMFYANRSLGVSAFFGLLLLQAQIAFAQETGNAGRSDASQSAQKVDLATIVSLLQTLQAEVRGLRVQVKDLKTQQESALAESADLRRELELTRSQIVATAGSANAFASEHVASETSTGQVSTEDRIRKLEEDQQLADAKIAEQNQTKVESASKYRALLSGIVLFIRTVSVGPWTTRIFHSWPFLVAFSRRAALSAHPCVSRRLVSRRLARPLPVRERVRISNLILPVASLRHKTGRRLGSCV